MRGEIRVARDTSPMNCRVRLALSLAKLRAKRGANAIKERAAACSTKGDEPFTVGACLNCRRPTAYCTCGGNLGWRAEAEVVVLSITVPNPKEHPK